MSFSIRAFGAVILICVSVATGRAYENYAERGLLEARELLRMLLHIRGKINAFLCPQSELLSDFGSDVLERVGFIGRIKEGAGLADAYKASGFSFPKEMTLTLESYFSDFGKRYKTDELARLDAVAGVLEKYVNLEESRLQKDVKIVKTLLGAAALGVAILMI